MAYIPKVWHHFITFRLIPTTNVCEVTAKRALLNYVILQDIPFDVWQVIEDAILHNRDAKMNLGHPFLIYGLCKQAGVPLEDNEAWIHLIKAIMVKRDKSVYHAPKRCMTRAMNPRMRMSFESIRLCLASRSTLMVTLARPPPIHHRHRLPQIHHHHSRPKRMIRSVLPLSSRTQCLTSLLVSRPIGMRPRSTESSSSRM